MIMANAVMMTGRKRVVPASIAAIDRIAVVQQPFFGEGNNQDAVGRRYAHAHDGSHQERER